MEEVYFFLIIFKPKITFTKIKNILNFLKIILDEVVLQVTTPSVAFAPAPSSEL
jgi:hypothetical protein